MARSRSRSANPWLVHLKAFRKSHPKLSVTGAAKAASKTYHKKGSVKSHSKSKSKRRSHKKSKRSRKSKKGIFASIKKALITPKKHRKRRSKRSKSKSRK